MIYNSCAKYLLPSFIYCVYETGTYNHSERTLIISKLIVEFFFLPLQNLLSKIFFSLSRSFLSSLNRSLCFLKIASSNWKLWNPLLLLLSSCCLASPSASVPYPFKHLLSEIPEYVTDSTLGSCKLEHFSCKIILASEKQQTCFSVTT